MSTAADDDQPGEGWDREGWDREGWDREGWDGGCCCHDGDCGCGSGPPAVSDAGLAELLDGPAAEAMYGLGIIRDVPAGQVPPAVMVQAVLGAQRLASWAKAQAMYWTAALARPGVAVPVTDVLDCIAHRNDGQLPAGPIPQDLTDRAAAGSTVVGDQVGDALLAAEAAGLAEPELSAAWLVAPITARRRIADAHELVDELPATFQALEDGRIEEIRARIIAETTAGLDPQLRRRAEALILDRAKRGMCPGDLRRLASKVVADVDPDAAGKRADQARGRRGTGVRELGDDLGRFTADLAAEDAALTQAVLDLLAKTIPAEHRAGRGTSQLRADIFADLFTALADTGLIDLRGINPDPADLDPADTNPDVEPDPNPMRPADTTAAEPDPDVPDPAGTDPADASRGRPAPIAADPAAAQPTAAQLLARLRSSNRPPHPDPDRQHRGGLLSHLRLPAGVRVNLDVTIALSTLTGHDDLSARLTGLGVITADTARALANAAGTVRILVTTNPPDPPGPPVDGSDRSDQDTGDGDPADPRRAQPNNGGTHHHAPDCGTILDFGRTTYRPPTTLIDRINTRDQRCRFPGCNQPATRCDHDHRTTWNHDGATCPCNLDTLCRYHHRTKTFTTWHTHRDQQTNTLTWTSPLGRTHLDQPPPDLPTGTPLDLGDTGTGSPGDNSPAKPPGTATPGTLPSIDPAETTRTGSEDPGGAQADDDRAPDDPPF